MVDIQAAEPGEEAPPGAVPPFADAGLSILAATGASFDQFMNAVRRGAAPAHTIPLIGFAQAGSGGFFDDGGFPVGSGWDEVAFPGIADEKVYALEIAISEVLYRI